jgi:hypothetical protein
MELTDRQKKFRTTWQNVLNECKMLGSTRGEEYGEVFADDLLLVGREHALRAMLAVKMHRLATTQKSEVIEDTLLDMICYCAMMISVRRELDIAE